MHLHLHFVFVSIQPRIYVIYTTGPAHCEDKYEHIPHHQRGRRRSELISREIKIFGHWWAQRPESHNKWPVRFSVVPTHLSLLLSKNKARQENFFTSWNSYLVVIFLAVQLSHYDIITLTSLSSHACTALHMISWTWINRILLFLWSLWNCTVGKLWKVPSAKWQCLKRKPPTFQLDSHPSTTATAEGVYSYRKAQKGELPNF